MRPPLRFDFNPTKLGQALAFLAARVQSFDKLKAAKLLYFADKHHLVRYGRPITGDRYVCMDYGPAPSLTLNLINDMLSPTAEITSRGHRSRQTLLSTVESFVQVADSRVQYPKLEPCDIAAELDALTEAELEVLTEVVARYGHLTAGQLIDVGHNERPWQISDAERPSGSAADIPWENIIAEAGEDQSETLSEYAAELQENREFLDALRAQVK